VKELVTEDRRWVALFKDPRWQALINDPRWAKVIRDRRWLTGGLIAGVTTVVILGLLFVTQPRGGNSVQPPSSLLAAPGPVTAGLQLDDATEAPTPTATKTADAKSTTGHKPAAKAKTKATAKAKAKKTTKVAKASSSGSGKGTGRIQFGRTYTGTGTFYAATGAGNCSFEASSNLMVGAMNQKDYDNSQACGATLAVTGPNGTVTIKVVDRCPECAPGAIDLSRQAFAKIAPTSAGKVNISWKLLSPAMSDPVSYNYKGGSTQYWCAIQVRNHRNPVASLQVKSKNGWKTLARQNYNYFMSADGSGCGGSIRVTDIYGNQLTDSGIRIAPDTLQRGDDQFPKVS
jgi:expansin (peptidoglycan-binding protein)